MAKTTGFVTLGPELSENHLVVDCLIPEIVIKAKMTGETGIEAKTISFRDFLWLKKQNLDFPVVITEKFG